MKHRHEYSVVQQYIILTPEQTQLGYSSELARMALSDAIYGYISKLPRMIESMSPEKDYEVKSHSLCFAPDGRTVILSILLQHSPSHAVSHQPG